VAAEERASGASFTIQKKPAAKTGKINPAHARSQRYGRSLQSRATLQVTREEKKKNVMSPGSQERRARPIILARSLPKKQRPNRESQSRDEKARKGPIADGPKSYRGVASFCLWRDFLQRASAGAPPEIWDGRNGWERILLGCFTFKLSKTTEAGVLVEGAAWQHQRRSGTVGGRLAGGGDLGPPAAQGLRSVEPRGRGLQGVPGGRKNVRQPLVSKVDAEKKRQMRHRGAVDLHVLRQGGEIGPRCLRGGPPISHWRNTTESSSGGEDLRGPAKSSCEDQSESFGQASPAPKATSWARFLVTDILSQGEGRVLFFGEDYRSY